MNRTIEGQLMKVKEEEALLERKRNILEREGIHIQQEKLRPLVGMAFKQGTRYYNVTGVPQIDWDNGMNFDPYQIPCLILTERIGKIVSMDNGFLFSNAIDSPNAAAYIRKEYQEIPRELFEEKLDQALKTLKPSENHNEEEDRNG